MDFDVRTEEQTVKRIESEMEMFRRSCRQLEEEAAAKDEQISQLMSRMREYEMSEYGLAEAVSEIKECHRIIRARDWEIEKLTDEINIMKLKVSELTENKNCAQSAMKIDENFSSEIHLITTVEASSPSQQKEKVAFTDKATQCCLPVQLSMYVEELCSSQVQNEMLRLQLKQVCEEALETSAHLQRIYRQEYSKYEESIKSLKEKISKLVSSSKGIEPSVMKGINKQSYEDLFEAALKRISSEDSEVQKIFHELTDQIKLLKTRNMMLIRRYLILADREDSARKENLKLRKALNFYWRKNNSYSTAPIEKEFPSKYLNYEEVHLLKDPSIISQNTCFSSLCQDNVGKLRSLIIKLLEELSVLQQLLEIAHHQTQAAEAVCFTQEVELKAVKDQFSLFQAQSDEKMLLGKLAMKVLQLQFNQGASVYELKRCKSDKQALQDWCSVLKKEYEENGRKFASMYLDAQDKVKHLREILKDLCQRCNTALSSYLPQS